MSEASNIGTGAAAGSAFGPWGTAIGAGIGALGGLLGFMHHTPQYSDIDLAKDNPELYKQIQANQALLAQANAAYQARRSGVTASEQMARSQAMAQTQNGLASQGLLGTSYGLSSATDQNNKLNASLQDRIYQEQLGLMQNAQNQGQTVYNQTKGALDDVMAAKQGQSAQQTGLYSGLMGAGAGLVSSSLTNGQLNTNNANYMNQFSGYPSYQQAYQVPNYQIQMPQFGAQPPGYNYHL